MDRAHAAGIALLALHVAGCAAPGAYEEEKRVRMFLAPGTMGLSLVMPSGFQGIGTITYSRKLRAAAKLGDDAEAVRSLTLGGNIDSKDGDGWSALMLAVDARHYHTAALLVESKTFSHGNKRAINRMAQTTKDEALAVAVQRRFPEMVELLLKNRASPNAANDDRQTVLMRAADVGDAAIVRMLLAAGADRTATDAAGQSAADWARNSSCIECQQALEGAGPPSPARGTKAQ